MIGEYECEYECHVTMRANRSAAEEAVRKLGHGWTFSCIEGDPLFGDVVLCYATNHFTEDEDAVLRVSWAAYELQSLGINVIRAKVEQVIFDHRYTGDNHAN